VLTNACKFFIHMAGRFAKRFSNLNRSHTQTVENLDLPLERGHFLFPLSYEKSDNYPQQAIG